jgi:hypothetical protein
MNAKLDMDLIAKKLGAERTGRVSARGGYFGALQLAADIAARSANRDSGNQPTDSHWDEQCLVQVSQTTLEQLE